MSCYNKECEQKLGEYRFYVRGDDKPYCSPPCIAKAHSDKTIIELAGTPVRGDLEELLKED